MHDSYRDRENCTVFVGDLPPGTAEDDLTRLFKDVCMVSPL
jgi:RNA recognition motif-containing protein